MYYWRDKNLLLGMHAASRLVEKTGSKIGLRRVAYLGQSQLLEYHNQTYNGRGWEGWGPYEGYSSCLDTCKGQSHRGHNYCTLQICVWSFDLSHSPQGTHLSITPSSASISFSFHFLLQNRRDRNRVKNTRQALFSLPNSCNGQNGSLKWRRITSNVWQ